MARICEVCHESRPRESYRLTQPVGKINVPVCRPCRVVQRDITREERKAEQERLRSEIYLCEVCLVERIHYKSKSGRCYWCAMKAQKGICSWTGLPATYTRKPVVREKQARVVSARYTAPPKPPRPAEPMPHSPNHPATPAQIKQREKAQAQPWLYLQIADDEWWLKSYGCQKPGCTRVLIAAGKCFTCSTGRERKEKFMSKYERGSAHDDDQHAQQDRTEEAA